MKKKIIGVILATAMFATLLTGCGGGSSETTANPDNAATEDAAPAEDTATEDAATEDAAPAEDAADPGEDHQRGLWRVDLHHPVRGIPLPAT